MIKKNSKFINILAFLGFLSLALLLGQVFLFNQIKQKNENISELESRLFSEMDKESYVISIQKMLDNLNTDITKFKDSVVKASGEVEFIESLEETARKNNLSIAVESIIAENDPKNPSTISTFKLRAITDGSWTNTYKFLAQLESFPYKLKVNNLFLSLSEKTQTSKTRQNWQAVFEIRVLEYKSQ